jgi:hypothetical protein
VLNPASASEGGRPAADPRSTLSRAHTPQVATPATAVHLTAVSRGTSSPTMTSSAMTPAEPSQKTEVTSQLMAAGGGHTARTMLSSTAELARMTGMDTRTTTTAIASRKASDARRRVVPPPRGPSTVDRSRCLS